MTGDPDACELLCLDLPEAEAIRQAMPGTDVLRASAARARALGEPTRLTIALASRDGECCVRDLAWIVGRDEKLVSHTGN